MAKTKEAKVKVSTRIRPRCDDCKMRIRGENHEEGTHHKSGGRGSYPKSHR